MNYTNDISDDEYIVIGKQKYLQRTVRSRFEKFNAATMEYVLRSLSENTTKVKNIKGYLLATLYNAPATMNNYYHAEVMHDMHGNY